jgi:hypothetical protein
MKVAKAKGRLRGKQPKLKPNQAKHLLELHDPGPTPKLSSPNFSVSGDPRSIGPSSGYGLNPSNPSGHSHIVPSSLNTQISAPQKFQPTK